LAPTVGIAATGFCYPGGILQIFSSTRSTNFTAADNRSSQIDSTEFIINISYHQHQLSSTSSRSSNASPSRIVEFGQIDGSQNNSSRIIIFNIQIASGWDALIFDGRRKHQRLRYREAGLLPDPTRSCATSYEKKSSRQQTIKAKEAY
jgi:hypothetical protein